MRLVHAKRPPRQRLSPGLLSGSWPVNDHKSVSG